MKARSCFGGVWEGRGCFPLMSVSDCFSCLEHSSKMPFHQKRGTNNTFFFFFPYLVWKELPEQGIENTLITLTLFLLCFFLNTIFITLPLTKGVDLRKHLSVM